jgi:cell division protease FtsH
VNKLVTESYERAKDVLKANIKGLTILAEILLEKEVIFSEDLERIFGKRRAEALKEEREAETKNTEVNGSASITPDDNQENRVDDPETEEIKDKTQGKKIQGKEKS